MLKLKTVNKLNFTKVLTHRYLDKILKEIEINQKKLTKEFLLYTTAEAIKNAPKVKTYLINE